MTTPAGTPSESAVTQPVPILVLDRKSNGRAIYDPEAKRALVQQCLQPGVSVAATALRAEPADVIQVAWHLREIT